MSSPSQEEIERAKHENWLQMCLEQFHRSRGEEWANGISHLIGVIFGIVGLTLMCVFSAQVGTAKDVTGCAIFGTALILLYTFSMLYHVFTNFRAKRVFQILDHCGIFLLIAGSYTPCVLMLLPPKIGWTIFGLQWGFAVAGILISCLCTPKLSDILTLPIYLIMG
jgi:hemolysin III